MHFSKTILSLTPLLLIPTVLALPTTVADTKRASCAATCGSVCYYQSTITSAISEGYKDYQAGKTEGGSTYPHTYNNYEGFTFPVPGPYQEFPVLSTFKVYTGGAPGPDRVIFNTKGQQAGVVTHTGASGDNFVSC